MSERVRSNEAGAAPEAPVVAWALGAMVLLLALTLLSAPFLLRGYRASGAPTIPADSAANAPAPATPPAAGAAAPQAVAFDPDAADRGSDLFVTCATCHGPNGLGMPKLGKDLVHSQFIRTHSNSDLVEFIKKGRDAADPLNTTKIPMPPKGGKTDLTEGQLADIVAYLRQLQQKS